MSRENTLPAREAIRAFDRVVIESGAARVALDSEPSDGIARGDSVEHPSGVTVVTVVIAGELRCGDNARRAELVSKGAELASAERQMVRVVPREDEPTKGKGK